MKKIVLVFVLVLTMVIAVLGCSKSSAQESATVKPTTAQTAEPVVLKVAHTLREELMRHKALMAFAEAVNKKTNGAIRVDVYPNAQLGTERDTVEGLQLGTVDMTNVSTAVIANFVPDYYLFDAPFLFEDRDDALYICNSDIGKNLGDQLFEKQGIHMLGFVDVGGRNMFSTKPIRSLADFKGLKIRTMENDLHIALFNMLGAQATPMAFAELYTALQQGTIDAGENALQGITGSGFHDLCKYIAITNHIYSINVLLMSDIAYKKIPEQYRDIFMEEVRNELLNENELVAAANEVAIDEMKEKNCEINYLNHDELVAAVSPIYDQFSDKLPSELIKKVQEYLTKK